MNLYSKSQIIQKRFKPQNDTKRLINCEFHLNEL